ncbi:hypothetical protein LIER_35938 [Lithospermum erythrorhizon]|uniref:Retrovirus-related Pol polyprotein from transposon TNT 1-94-like beta-barrel domain-containing protein n=1 Tax=Lithospermum erythrorhizon TaxID=34254 RepID=A0AAV3NYP8_LITER
MSNEKQVRKVLRSLPKRFENKVIAIEEAQDLSNMRLDELIGNLTTFEMKIDSADTIKKKGIALKANCKDGKEEDLAETMNLLTKIFNKPMKRKYEGFGHIQVQCLNYVKKQAKGYYATHSDDYTDGGNEDVEDTVSNFVAFTTAILKEDCVTPTLNQSACHYREDEGEITEEEIMANYQMLFDKWSKLTKTYTFKEAERQKLESKYSQPRMEWVKKIAIVSHVVFTSLKATAWEGWYFNSECSKHMTGDKSNLSDIKKLSGDFVTFEGGAKGKITGKEILRVDGLPGLKDVLLVDGLTVNLISISQLCDEGMQVAFNKNACIVSNTDKLIMKGARSLDNCYLWNPHKALSSRKQEI